MKSCDSPNIRDYNTLALFKARGNLTPGFSGIEKMRCGLMEL